jgi:hypothetical protein
MIPVITRNDKTLTIKMDSGLGFHMHFDNMRECVGDAAVWHDVLNRKLKQIEEAEKKAIDLANAERTELAEQLAKHQALVIKLLTRIGRLKAQLRRNKRNK